jgi:hypothetical protein
LKYFGPSHGPWEGHELRIFFQDDPKKEEKTWKHMKAT